MIYFAVQMEVSFFVVSQAVFPAVIHQLFGHSLFLAACLHGISYPSLYSLLFSRQNPFFPKTVILSLSAFNWQTPSFESISFSLVYFFILGWNIKKNSFIHSTQSTNMYWAPTMC